MNYISLAVIVTVLITVMIYMTMQRTEKKISFSRGNRADFEVQSPAKS